MKNLITPIKLASLMIIFTIYMNSSQNFFSFFIVMLSAMVISFIELFSFIVLTIFPSGLLDRDNFIDNKIIKGRVDKFINFILLPSDSEKSSKYIMKDKILIFIIIILGFFLRIMNFHTDILSGDETATYRFSHGNFFNLIHNIGYEDCHPPLFYIIQFFITFIFGRNILSIKIATILFSTFTIYLVFLIGKLLFNKNLALVSSLLLAINPYHIYLARYVRMYSLLIFLSTLSFYLLLKIIEGNNDYIRYINLLSILLLFTHYMSIFLVITIFLILWRYKKEELIFNFKKDIYLIISLIFLYSGWIIYVFSIILKKSSIPLTYWLKKQGIIVLFNLFTIFDWNESNSFFIYFFILSTLPLFYFKKRDIELKLKIVYIYFWFPFISYFIFTKILSAISGTGIFQINHLSYILIPAILLLVNMKNIIKNRILSILFILLIILRPSITIIEKNIIPEINPYHSVIRTFNDIKSNKKIILINPDSFKSEFINSGNISKKFIKAINGQNIEKVLETLGKFDYIFEVRIYEKYSDSTKLSDRFEKNISKKLLKLKKCELLTGSRDKRRIKLIIFSKKNSCSIIIPLNNYWFPSLIDKKKIKLLSIISKKILKPVYYKNDLKFILSSGKKYRLIFPKLEIKNTFYFFLKKIEFYNFMIILFLFSIFYNYYYKFWGQV